MVALEILLDWTGDFSARFENATKKEFALLTWQARPHFLTQTRVASKSGTWPPNQARGIGPRRMRRIAHVVWRPTRQDFSNYPRFSMSPHSGQSFAASADASLRRVADLSHLDSLSP